MYLALRDLVNTALLCSVLPTGHSEEMNNKCEQEDQLSSPVKLIRAAENDVRFAVR